MKLIKIFQQIFNRRHYFKGMNWGSDIGYTCKVDGYRQSDYTYITEVEFYDKNGKKVDLE